MAAPTPLSSDSLYRLCRSIFALGSPSVWPYALFFQNSVIFNIEKLPKLYTFCQTLNKPSTIWQRFIKFCRSGEISPILITLVSIRKSTPLHLSLILACFWQYVLIFGEAINFSFDTQEEEKEKEGRCNEENDWKTFVYPIPFRVIRNTYTRRITHGGAL